MEYATYCFLGTISSIILLGWWGWGYKVGQPVNYKGKRVLITGGSQGLGLEIAKKIVCRGANVTIVARDIEKLKRADAILQCLRKSPNQIISYISADLSKAEEASNAVNATHPDIVYCCAGNAKPGFLIDLEPLDLLRGIEANYLTALYTTHSSLRSIIETPKDPSNPQYHIVMVSSVLAFMGMSCYSAYAPMKAALRSLADTLRQEVIAYPSKNIRIHCAFPATIHGEAYDAEKKIRPQLLDILEAGDEGQSGEEVAMAIIEGVDRNDFLIHPEFKGRVLKGGMFGASPSNNIMIDMILVIISAIIWPFLRWEHDRLVRRYGHSQKA